MNFVVNVRHVREIADYLCNLNLMDKIEFHYRVHQTKNNVYLMKKFFIANRGLLQRR